jgi:hypothetical protein
LLFFKKSFLYEQQPHPELKLLAIWLSGSLEPFDACVILGIEADAIAVFASPLVLADHPDAAFKGAVSSVEMFPFGELADYLL